MLIPDCIPRAGQLSRAFGLEFGPQRGFTDHRVRDAEDYESHRDYIHQNPVKRGLVERAATKQMDEVVRTLENLKLKEITVMTN